MQSGETGDPVHSLTVQLGQLELTISVRNIGGSAGSSVPPVTLLASTGTSSSLSAAYPTRAPAGAAPVIIDFDLSPRVEDQIIAASAAGDLLRFSVPHIEVLIPLLRGSDRVWTPRARLLRAFRAGLLSRRRLEGEFWAEDSPVIPFRNSFYVVLRSRHHGPPFWTRQYSTYAAGVFVVQGVEQVFENSTVSHAFATQAECVAFLSGSRTPWPPERP